MVAAIRTGPGAGHQPALDRDRLADRARRGRRAGGPGRVRPPWPCRRISPAFRCWRPAYRASSRRRTRRAGDQGPTLTW